MVHAMPEFFYVSVQHGCIRAHAQLMPFFVYSYPLVTGAFILSNLFTNFRMKYLCTTTRDRFQAGIFHHFHAGGIIYLRLFKYIMVFNRGKGLHMQPRAMRL